MDQLTDTDLVVSPFEVESGTEEYDLSSHDRRGERTGRRSAFSYNTDLFEAATIERMMATLPEIYWKKHSRRSQFTQFAATSPLEGGKATQSWPGSMPTALITPAIAAFITYSRPSPADAELRRRGV